LFFVHYSFTMYLTKGESMTTQKMQHQHSEETRLALLEQSINNINNTLVRFEKRFDQIDAQIGDMRGHFDRLIGGLYFMFGTAFVALIIKFVH
jgi:septal ring factor EnvC (AmiA/AmiB activator)